jgi:peptidoglycan/LPS O-acetylase OafA/YrhL
MPGLDLLRGALALGVASYHLSVWFAVFPSGSVRNMALAKVGNLGVSAFFMLSGFLIFRLQTWETVRREGLGRWYLKRYLRLAPVFYLAVALNLVFHLGMGPTASPRMIAENLTLAFGAIHPNHALTVGGWYVGLVVLLYALFPLLVWLRDRLGFPFLLLGTLGLWAWSLPSTLHLVMGAPQSERFHVYVQPANQAFLFLLGGLGAWLHGRWTWRLPQPAFWLLLSLWLLIFLRPVPFFSDHLQVMTGWLRYRYLLMVFILLLLFAFREGASSPWTRPMVALGVWSYSSYLLHPFVYRWLEPRISGMAGFLTALFLSFLVAALVERWVERPASALAGRWPFSRPRDRTK